jgi:PKHD-type hydroxylase
MSMKATTMQLQINASQDARGPVIFPAGDLSGAAQPGSPQFLRTNNHVAAPMLFTGIFSPAECDLIMELGLREPQLAGRMMRAQYMRRKSNVAWLGVGANTLWLYEKLWQIFTSVNRWYSYGISGLVDEIQFTTYAAGDSIDWHLDTGTGQTSTRKISISVQLSEQADYLGGDLQFCGCTDLQDARRRGTIVVFPSFLAHRVSPVTSGTRFSLVSWAHGLPFT